LTVEQARMLAAKASDKTSIERDLERRSLAEVAHLNEGRRTHTRSLCTGVEDAPSGLS
jgi:hypothetical protein